MRRIIVLAAVILAFAGSFLSAQTNLTASLAHIPDLADSPDKGIFVDLVKAIDDVYKEGTITIKVSPFARSFENVMRGKADFHIPSFVDPNIPEEKLPFGYVAEPMGTVKLLLYSNSAEPISLADIEAAMARGGDFPYVIEVGAGMKIMFPFPTKGSNNMDQSLKKVNAGRIHAYIWPPEADLLVRDLKLGNIHREIYSDFDDIIVVAKSPRGEEVSRIIEEALKELRRQGRLKQFHDKVHLPYTDWQPHESNL